LLYLSRVIKHKFSRLGGVISSYFLYNSKEKSITLMFKKIKKRYMEYSKVVKKAYDAM